MAYTLFTGEIPEGLVIMHTCDRPSCVNPDHLRTGTLSDNTKDAFAKGRMRARRGETNEGAKITAAQVTEIRTSQERLVDIAPRFGVSVQTICDIQHRRTWRHLP